MREEVGVAYRVLHAEQESGVYLSDPQPWRGLPWCARTNLPIGGVETLNRLGETSQSGPNKVRCHGKSRQNVLKEQQLTMGYRQTLRPTGGDCSHTRSCLGWDGRQQNNTRWPWTENNGKVAGTERVSDCEFLDKAQGNTSHTPPFLWRLQG